MEAKPLTLTNENNRLNCDGFIQIHFAPAHGSVRESDFDKIYSVNHDGAQLFLKLIDFKRTTFENIGSVYTIPSTGMTGDAWAKQWLKKYPKTKPDTEMAIYCYQRLKD